MQNIHLWCFVGWEEKKLHPSNNNNHDYNHNRNHNHSNKNLPPWSKSVWCLWYLWSPCGGGVKDEKNTLCIVRSYLSITVYIHIITPIHYVYLTYSIKYVHTSVSNLVNILSCLYIYTIIYTHINVSFFLSATWSLGSLVVSHLEKICASQVGSWIPNVSGSCHHPNGNWWCKNGNWCWTNFCSWRHVGSFWNRVNFYPMPRQKYKQQKYVVDGSEIQFPTTGDGHKSRS